MLQKSILGYKCLTLMLSDGCSQMFIDFSLHGEQGKNKEKVQGLTAGQRKARFSKDYKGQAVQERVDEYLRKKTETAIGMIKNAIKRGFRFDYILVDSWFTNTDLVKFVATRRIKCHLLGMAKRGNTKYDTEYGCLNTNQIIKALKKDKLCKYCRTLRCTYCQIDALLAGKKVRLFFCKHGRKGEWNVLLTTDSSLTFLKAYRLYARRWATEVGYYVKHIVM